MSPEILEESDRPTDETVFQALYRTKAHRLLIIIFAYCSCILFMLPILPTLVTNSFASRRAGQPMHCETYKPQDAPPSCQDAHSDVVLYATWSGFAQNAVFSFVLTPALGAWSDIHGRKPFLLIAQFLVCFPLIIVALNIYTGLSLSWYYIVTAFTGSVTTIAPSLSYLADSVPPTLRAPSFGLFLAAFSVAVLVGPPIGAALPVPSVPIAALGGIVICMFSTWLLLPESLSEQSKTEALKLRARYHRGHGHVGEDSVLPQTQQPLFDITDPTKHSGPKELISSTLRAMSILTRNAMFIRLTLVLMVGAVVSEGIQDILIQYLQIKLNFGPVDVSAMFMVFGACALVVQGFLLRFLIEKLGEKRLLLAGLVAGIFQQCGLALATSKWQVLVSVAMGSLGSVTFPTISSIKSNAAADNEQGSVQGALNGAKALASGVGPLAFAWLFTIFTRSDSELPYFPSAPFVLAVVLMLVVVVLALGLPNTNSEGAHHHTMNTAYMAVPTVSSAMDGIEID